MTTGDDIRNARQRAGLTQAELAQRIGVSMRTVGNWERGDTPPDRYAARIAAVLNGLINSAERPSIEDYSDAALLAEIARRFDRTRSARGHTHRTPVEDRPVRDGATTRHLSAVPGTLSRDEREELYRSAEQIDLESEPYAAADPKDPGEGGEPV